MPSKRSSCLVLRYARQFIQALDGEVAEDRRRLVLLEEEDDAVRELEQAEMPGDQRPVLAGTACEIADASATHDLHLPLASLSDDQW